MTTSVHRELDEIYTNSGGFLHRTDGPALIRRNGTREWWISGWRMRTQKMLQEALELTNEEMLHFFLINGSFN